MAQRSKAMCQVHIAGKSGGNGIKTPVHLTFNPSFCTYPLPSRLYFFCLSFAIIKEKFPVQKVATKFPNIANFCSEKQDHCLFSTNLVNSLKFEVDLLFCSSVSIVPLAWTLGYITQLLSTDWCLSSQGIPMRNFKEGSRGLTIQVLSRGDYTM